MIRRFSIVSFSLLILLALPHPEAGVAASPAEPRAAAWAMSIALPSAGQVLLAGQSSASSGDKPRARRRSQQAVKGREPSSATCSIPTQ